MLSNGTVKQDRKGESWLSLSPIFTSKLKSRVILAILWAKLLVPCSWRHSDGRTFTRLYLLFVSIKSEVNVRLMGHKSECWTNIQIFCPDGTWQLIPMYMNVFTKVQSIWHLFSHFTENHKCQPHGVAMKKSGGFIILVLWMAVPNSFVPIHSVSVEIFHRIKTFWVPWRSLQNNTSIIQRLLRYSNSWNSLDQSGWTDTHTNRQTDRPTVLSLELCHLNG